MAKRKRLSLKSVHRRRKKCRKKKLKKTRTLYNAFREYKDLEVTLTPTEIRECVRACLKCAKESVWGASKISLKKPRVFWNTKLRTYNGNASPRVVTGKKIGEIHINASKSHRTNKNKESVLRTLRHEVGHIVQYRIGNKMGHRQDFKLIEKKFDEMSSEVVLILD